MVSSFRIYSNLRCLEQDVLDICEYTLKHVISYIVLVQEGHNAQSKMRIRGKEEYIQIKGEEGMKIIKEEMKGREEVEQERRW